MKLFLLTQYENTNYNTYDSIVVAAQDEELAKQILPENESWGSNCSSWCSSPEKVSVKYLGQAAKGIKQGIILASFNAG